MPCWSCSRALRTRYSRSITSSAISGESRSETASKPLSPELPVIIARQEIYTVALQDSDIPQVDWEAMVPRTHDALWGALLLGFEFEGGGVDLDQIYSTRLRSSSGAISSWIRCSVRTR